MSPISTSAATSGIGIRYASRNVRPSFNRLCSADKNTIEQQQHEPAKIMHINAMNQYENNEETKKGNS